jgi:cellulose synthase/poly-beta-1,6-N-acetylglucosamine synthase-like glycosyltransferase
MGELWQWMQPGLLWLAIVNLAFVLVCFGLLAASARLTRRLKEVVIPQKDVWPSVSLIAPARNEERNIERAVQSLVQIDYPTLEITIVNDRSTDRTGQILGRLAAEFPQVNVVHVDELPPGWLGKNHALQLGADRSNAEWLLFTDGDIVVHPTALRRAVAYALQNNVDHLAAWPDIHSRSWLLSGFLVTFAVYLLLFVRLWAVRNVGSKAHVGIGAFNLVRKEVYQAVGGHKRIHMRPDDDLKLGKIIKLGGYRQDLVHGGGMISVEMYQSMGELVRSLEKNVFSAFEYNPWLHIVTSMILFVFNVWPYIAVFAVSGPARWVYLAVCLMLWCLAWCAARVMNVAPIAALAFPLGVLMLLYIQWRTMLLNYYHGGIRWRGTHYSLAELRANRV